MKTCPSCNTQKDISEFGSNRNRPDGLSFYCKTCSKERANAFAKTPDQQAKRQGWYQANKTKVAEQAKARWDSNKSAYEPARKRWAELHRGEMLGYLKDKRVDFNVFIDGLKSVIPCKDCGMTYPSYVMEYDHVMDGKRFNISRMTNHKRDRVLEEIAKCDLVCCRCHRIRSQSRRPEPLTQRLIQFRDWIRTLKSSPCRDCGGSFPPEAMDFDHVADNKVDGISQMWSWGRDKVLAEIEKCELVCANCHRERTIQRRATQIEEAA